MSDDNVIMCVRCSNACDRRAIVCFGNRQFCSTDCLDVWSAGRDTESLSRIDALEASNDANLAVAKEAQRMLDLREQQLADCTRAMLEVSAVLRSWGSGETWCCLADKLDAARAGKAGA